VTKATSPLSAPPAEKHPGALESLRVLLNHSRVDTTQVYSDHWRGRRRSTKSGTSAGLRVQSNRKEAHMGFERVFAETEVPEPLRRTSMSKASKKTRDGYT
jgi:hypothetical protein